MNWCENDIKRVWKWHQNILEYEHIGIQLRNWWKLLNWIKNIITTYSIMAIILVLYKPYNDIQTTLDDIEMICMIMT
jgi:hypothetical protein